MRTVALLALFLLIADTAFAAEPSGKNSPEYFSSAANIRNWVELNKGFGAPSSAEFSYPTLHVFVAWNSPFSGPASNFVYAYAFDSTQGRWAKIDESFFPQPESLLYAYLHPTTKSLVYVSVSGTVLRRIPLGRFDLSAAPSSPLMSFPK